MTKTDLIITFYLKYHHHHHISSTAPVSNHHRHHPKRDVLCMYMTCAEEETTKSSSFPAQMHMTIWKRETWILWKSSFTKWYEGTPQSNPIQFTNAPIPLSTSQLQRKNSIPRNFYSKASQTREPTFCPILILRDEFNQTKFYKTSLLSPFLNET